MPQNNKVVLNDLNQRLAALHQSMANTLANHITEPGDQTTAIANLSLFRREEVTKPSICLVEPSVVMVVQGAKQMLVGNEEYCYDTTHYLVTSLDLPATSDVLAASPEEPCLGFLLKLDLQLLGELSAQNMASMKAPKTGASIGLGKITPPILEPFSRLIGLLDEPSAIEVIAPLIQKEIHYRLLMSEQAPLLQQIASVDNHGYRIAKVIDWLKVNYSSTVRIEELAAQAQMSAPTFHHHFRRLTAMSPLQYQKWLRLNEAKRLMLNEHQDVASTAFRVGYESPSQFSREYSRLFGISPKRDMEALRRKH